MTRIGLISDTHGLLRPEALAFLKGCDHIVHGGDIGGPEVLQRLAAIAPLTAVRGNNDRQPWADAVPDTDMVQVGGIFLLRAAHPRGTRHRSGRGRRAGGRHRPFASSEDRVAQWRALHQPRQRRAAALQPADLDRRT